MTVADATRHDAPEYVIQGATLLRVLTDQLGSPRIVVDATTGAVVERMTHDEFGNAVQDTSPGLIPFGFAGGLYDVDTGLVRFGARDYDPSIGRWVTKDPSRFRGGANLYAYASGDPVNYVDPDGKNPIAVAAAAVAVGVAVWGGLEAALLWKNEMRDDAEDRYPAREGLPPFPGESDAFQHCLASCTVAQAWGSGTSAFLGWANETNATWGGTQTPEEEIMDNFNNACGRSYSSPSTVCALACRGALGQGVLERRDEPNYPAP